MPNQDENQDRKLTAPSGENGKSADDPSAESEFFRKLYEESEERNWKLQDELAAVRMQYAVISGSFFWKVTKPLRWLTDLLKKILRRVPGVRQTARFFRCLKQNGLRYTLRRVKAKFGAKKRAKRQKKADEQAVLEAQRAHRFERDVRISIVVPLYHTPKPFLLELIRSVQAQTYPNWELCFADGSDREHGEVGKIVLAEQEKDERIRYCKLEKNLGISGNTNAAIGISTGEYISLLDHDDLLHPSALYEVMRAICEKGADFIYTDETTFSKTPEDAYQPHYKPDFSPDLLRSYNYICHLTTFSRALMDQVGMFDSAFDGSQDYDMILRLTERAEKIVHIPQILYFWRASAQSTASNVAVKPYTLDAAKRALAAHLARVGLNGKVTDGRIPSTYRIRYRIQGKPLVSILIPNMDHIDVLSKCVESVETRSTYTNFEILIIENNSRQEATFEYYRQITQKYPNIRVIRWEGTFNFSAINNFGIAEMKGDYCILLNNDIEILTPSWIEEMLMFVQRPDVGAAGMMLYYPDNTVQHAGVILGIGGIAGHSHKYFKRGSFGYMSRMAIAQDLSAVTAACMMVKSAVLREVGGLDESLAVAFNDVDLCLKIRKAGYLIVFTPFAEAYHYESKSRGAENTPEKVARFNREIDRFREKWGKELDAGDPYYNPHLSLEFEDFRLK